MRAGAADYVLKGNLTRLAPAVEREIRGSVARAARRRTEAALQASERRYARLAESGIIGLVVADVDGGTYEANDACLRMLGYSQEELASGALRWTDLTPAEWRPLDAAALAQLKERGVAVPWEKELLGKDGSRVPVLMGAAMLDDRTFLGFVANLTERKRAEENLRVTEEQFRQAQKMEAIGRLAGGIAHDFNNLLTAILGYGELLRDRVDDRPELVADLDEIVRAGHLASDLTRHLLAFSRKQVLAPEVLDLNALVARVEKILRRMIGEDIQLIAEPGPLLGRVRADPAQLEQVLMNLAVNSRDAMPRGGTLTIETASAVLDAEFVRHHIGVHPGRYVSLRVADTGDGMKPEVMEHIFEPFFTTKGLGKGTGLGLSTVYGIVNQSGGCITVESRLGHGAAFTIYLPTVDQPDEPMTPAAPAGRTSGTETILLVEDQEVVRRLVRTMLETRGYVVLEAKDPDGALRIAESHATPIDLLLSDVVMPGTNGPDLAQRILMFRPSMKVLYMSGFPAATHLGRLSSRAAFLPKPFTGEILTRKVRECLDRSPGRSGVG